MNMGRIALRTEEEGGHGRSADNSRLVLICEVVLLRLVTVTAAWAASRTPARWPRPDGSSPRR